MIRKSSRSKEALTGKAFAIRELQKLGVDTNSVQAREYIATFIKDDTKALIVADLLGLDVVRQATGGRSGRTSYRPKGATDRQERLFYGLIRCNLEALEWIESNII